MLRELNIGGQENAAENLRAVLIELTGTYIATSLSGWKRVMSSDPGEKGQVAARVLADHERKL